MRKLLPLLLLLLLLPIAALCLGYALAILVLRRIYLRTYGSLL